MGFDIAYSIILNMSVLLLFAQLMTKVSFVKSIIIDNKQSFKTKIILLIVFGLLGIFATSNGVYIQNSIVNIRTTPIVSGGILFGPIVGIGSSVIAAIHRLFFSGGDFTSLACSISTIVAGIIGSRMYYKFKNKKDYLKIALFVMLIETIQMILIVLISQPTEDAIQLVKYISLPMIIINSLGVTLFISVFESVFTTTEIYSAKMVAMVLKIAQEALPFLRKGIDDKSSMQQAAKIIQENSNAKLVAITNLEDVLALHSIKKREDRVSVLDILIAARKYNFTQDDNVYRKNNYICAPLYSNEKIIGYLVILIEVNSLVLKSKIEFVDGLAKIMSTQLELANVDKSYELLKKAEYDALQAQINPHFIFNILNTIYSVSRTDSQKARNIILDLSEYLRNVLSSDNITNSLQTELENVQTYFQLEQARFGDKIKLEIIYDEIKDISIPRFIIQPLIENSIKHAFKYYQTGLIIINITYDDHCNIDIIDNGQGIMQSIVDNLDNTSSSDGIGLINIHSRLKSYYGDNYGLVFSSDEMGTKISIRVPINEV